jgi:hypothetical protein
MVGSAVSVPLRPKAAADRATAVFPEAVTGDRRLLQDYFRQPISALVT